MSRVPGTEVDGLPPGWRRPVDWAAAVAWCREHPGRTREVTDVYANAPYSVRKRYPDIDVTSGNYRWIEDGSFRRRICDVRLTFDS